MLAMPRMEEKTHRIEQENRSHGRVRRRGTVFLNRSRVSKVRARLYVKSTRRLLHSVRNDSKGGFKAVDKLVAN